MRVLQPLIAWTHRLRPRLMLDILRTQISRTVPFARHLGVSVEEMQAGRARTLLVEKPELLNHVGTFHAGAVFTACEAASGAALVAVLAPVVMQVRFVVRDATIDYLKAARGALHAQATVVDEIEPVLQALEAAGRVEVAIDVCARGAKDEVVAKATFNWVVRRAPDAAKA